MGARTVSAQLPLLGRGTPPDAFHVERLSIELTNRCGKGCWFCYNRSGPDGESAWSEQELVALVLDCAHHGVRAVSFGGGEPLESALLYGVLSRLHGTLFRSLTTNGLLLDEHLERLVAARPDKVHVSVHFPANTREVERVARQVSTLAGHGIASGVNLLVARSQLPEARRATAALRASGIDLERIVFLPQRGRDTPTPEELAAVASTPRFQSMSCLLSCAASPRFCSLAWDRTVAWCSYTRARRRLGEATHAGLVAALDGLPLVYCGEEPTHG